MLQSTLMMYTLPVSNSRRRRRNNELAIHFIAKGRNPHKRTSWKLVGN